MGSRSELKGRALGVVVGSLGAQVGLGCMYLSQVLTPAMLTEFAWSRGDFMAASSPRTFTAALMSPVIGFLTHRFGTRPVVGFSLLLLAAAYALTSRIDALWQVFGLSVAIGVVVAGVGDIAVGTVVSRWVLRARGLALGIVYSGSNLGGLLVSILGAWSLVEFGWRATWLYVGLAVLVLLFPLAWALIREPPLADAKSGEGAGDAGSDAAAHPGAADDPRGSERDDFAAAIRSRDFWVLGFALFVFYFYYLGVNAHLVLFLTDQGLSIGQASASFGVTVFLGVTAKVGIGLVADRWPARTALLVNFGLVLVASLVLLAMGRGGLLPLFILVHGVATAAQNVVYPMIVAERFGTPAMARVYGVLMLALLPGGVLGPVFAGYLFDLQGSYQTAFGIFAGLNAVSLVALFSIRMRKPATLA